MRAIHTFNLPRDNYEYRCAQSAGEMYRELCEIEKHLRSKLKYSELSEETRAELQLVRDMLPHRALQWIGDE
jgi:hypothetical protein